MWLCGLLLECHHSSCNEHSSWGRFSWLQSLHYTFFHPCNPAYWVSGNPNQSRKWLPQPDVRRQTAAPQPPLRSNWPPQPLFHPAEFKLNTAHAYHLTTTLPPTLHFTRLDLNVRSSQQSRAKRSRWRANATNTGTGEKQQNIICAFRTDRIKR